MKSPKKQIEPLVCIKNTKMHRFIEGHKVSFNQGICKLIKIQNQQQSIFELLLNVNTFYQTLTDKSQIIKIKYLKSNTYIFQTIDKQIISLSFSTDHVSTADYINQFQEILQSMQILMNYNQWQSALKYKINQVYPNISQRQIYKSNGIKGILKTATNGIGDVFGTFNNLFKQKKSNKTKIDNYQDSVSEIKKFDWENIKDKASQINNKMNKFIKPVSSQASKFAKIFGKKISESDINSQEVEKIHEQSSNKSSSKKIEKSQEYPQNKEAKNQQKNQEDTYFYFFD